MTGQTKKKCGLLLQIRSFLGSWSSLSNGIFALGFFLSLGYFAGCDRSEELVQLQQQSNSSTQLVSTAVSPKSILDNCISRYQSLKSYEDSGFVRLRYKIDGKLAEDRAPMSVAWNAGGKLGLSVYALRAGPVETGPVDAKQGDSGYWHLSLGKSYPELAGQVLSRTLPEKIDLPWLLSEPVISDSLSAGLGGFPPQLDLLLSPKPLSKLTEQGAAIESLGVQSIDSSACSVVAVKRNELAYKFWIDKESNLVRRLELPTQMLPQEILSDASISQLELSIEFADGRTNSSIDWTRFQVETDSSTLLVTQFAAPPPTLEIGTLGKQIPAFRMSDPNGGVAFDSTPKHSRKATVLMWLADHPACLVAAEQLAVMKEQLSKAGVPDNAVEVVPIWAESQPPSGLTFEQLVKQWKLPGRLAVDRNAAGRDLFQVQEAPTVVILDSQNKLQFIDVRLNPTLDRALVPLVARVVEGVNVADELKLAQQSTLVRHRAHLARLAAGDAPTSQTKFDEAYPPESIQLGLVDRVEFPSRIVTIAQDTQQSIWTLLSNGTLQVVDGSLKKKNEYKLQSSDHSERTRLAPSPDCRYVAVCTGSKSIEILDTKSQQSNQFPIPSGASVNDLQWLTVGDTTTHRLAVITSNKQVLLLDPANREQLSGSCNSEPMAIVTQSGSGDVDGLVVLRDGTLEPLKLSSESTSPKAKPVKHPISTSSAFAGRQLAFRPGSGPWTWSQNAGTKQPANQQLLATGVLGANEPALMVLDSQLAPVWHYRLPFEHTSTSVGQSQSFVHRVACAASPANGASIWAVLDSTGTVHILRGDMQWADDFRPHAKPCGIALQAVGDRLHLIIASQNMLSTMKLD